jgi:hypothetical protein
LPEKAFSQSEPAITAKEVAPLLEAARACANLIEDSSERALALARVAEVEHLTGTGSGEETLARAEQLARAVAVDEQGDGLYRSVSLLCTVAEARHAIGGDPTELLLEAERRAEKLPKLPDVDLGPGTVSVRDGRKVIELLSEIQPAECERVAQEVAAVVLRAERALAGWFLSGWGPRFRTGIFEHFGLAGWYLADHISLSEGLSDVSRTFSGATPSARDELQRDREEAQQRMLEALWLYRMTQQLRLRNLARARVAGAWYRRDATHALELAQRIGGEADRLAQEINWWDAGAMESVVLACAGDPADRARLLLYAAPLAVMTKSPGAEQLSLAAMDSAGSRPAKDDEQVRARARAVCALMLAAPGKAQGPLKELRGEIAQIQDPALRALLLGDLVVAARASDPVLATELFDDGVRALEDIKVSRPFTLFGLPLGTGTAANRNIDELLNRGYGLLVEGYTISPARATDACVAAFRVLEPLATMDSGPSLEASPYPGESMADLVQWGVLRLLASHDIGRATALAEQGQSPLARAWGLCEIGVALAASDPQRAREFLDRAWEIAEQDLANLTKEVGLDSRGQFNIKRPGAGFGRRGDLASYYAEANKLYTYGARLLHIMGLQTRIGVATRYARGEQSLALQRCRRSLETAKRVPAWARDTMYYHTGYAAGLITAAVWSVDAAEGAKVAAEIRGLVGRNSRPVFAASASAHLALLDPAAGLEFLIEAIENTPPARTTSPTASPWWLGAQVLKILGGGSRSAAATVAGGVVDAARYPRFPLPGASMSSFSLTARLLKDVAPGGPPRPGDSERVGTLAARIPLIVRQHRPWARDVALTLADLMLFRSSAERAPETNRASP